MRSWRNPKYRHLPDVNKEDHGTADQDASAPAMLEPSVFRSQIQKTAA
jgi:hypothetical protein